VPVGLVAVFGAVFAAANPVVERWIGSLFAHSSLSWFPSPLRFVFWALCAIAAAGLLRPAVRELPGLTARLGGTSTEEASASTILTIARNGMVGLNALFLGYNALDAVYLWAGRAPTGVSHTEYAHAGAAWLTVALVLSTLVLGSLYRGAMLSDPRAKAARVLAYVWAGQNFILAAGTFRRITMYVAYSGLTELRILGIFGTALATVGLAIVVYRVSLRRTMLWVLRRQLDALTLAVVIFVVSPTSWIAMRYNVAQIGAAQYRPLLHLFQQRITPEAIPAMLPLLDHDDPTVRGGVAARLIERRYELHLEAARATRWTEHEASLSRALRVLDAIESRLEALAPTDARADVLGRLRATAYGINDEVERPGDDAPFDFRSRRYAN
jgi:hypothetical protein